MKRFFICLCIVVSIFCGAYLLDYFNRNTSDSNVSASGERYTLAWEKYPDATEYSVYIDDVFVRSVEDSSADITQYLIDDKTYKIEVKTITVGSGETTVYTENYRYSAATKSDFQRKTFFMNGETYDYNIESLNEYEVFVWYNVLYRKSNVKWYNSCLTINEANVNRLTYSYIVSYPEYDGVVSTNIYGAKVSSNIYRIASLNYYLPTDFTLSVENCTFQDDNELCYYKQGKSQYIKATNFNHGYERASSPSQRSFPIDSNTLKVPVYNTEQLFMAVQYGAAPDFKEGSTVAQTCYNNAKAILSEINNSDSLTDYQKALNIYRYICMNVSYDHILFNFMAHVKNYTVDRFGKFSSFYIEGVLYNMDNQVAVCDGLSKAYVLMCAIEGIEASKVNGTADGGEHAWNKVKLGDDYYMVDTTWGTVSYQSGPTYHEALSHGYFLISEDDMTTHDASFELPSKKTINYNYYSNYAIGTFTANIQNDEQLILLKEYIATSSQTAYEIKIDKTFAATIAGRGKKVVDYVLTALNTMLKQVSIIPCGPDNNVMLIQIIDILV